MLPGECKKNVGQSFEGSRCSCGDVFDLEDGSGEYVRQLCVFWKKKAFPWVLKKKEKSASCEVKLFDLWWCKKCWKTYNLGMSSVLSCSSKESSSDQFLSQVLQSFWSEPDILVLFFAFQSKYGYLGKISVGGTGRAEFRMESNRVKVWDVIGRSLVLQETGYPQQSSADSR